MNFDDRLQKAIERGEKTRRDEGRAALERRLSQEELRALYSKYRLELTEHIETCLRKLAEHLPGFKYQSVLGDEGWGARIARDDLHLRAGRAPETRYSRLEIVVSPLGSMDFLEIVAKGAVRNREILNRKQYQMLEDFDLDSFKELIDLRVIEFAERYTATT